MLVAQSCQTLQPHGVYSLPGSSVQGILQARKLAWIAIPFSRESSQPRDRIQVSCTAGRFLTIWATSDHNILSIYLLMKIGYSNRTMAMAPHSSTLAWKIPWMDEPGRLQSMGSWRVGHDWTMSLSLFTFMHWRRKWQPTPVFLPGESQGQRGLVGCRLWGHTESDTTEVT